MLKGIGQFVIVAAVCACAVTASAVNIETVTVGNPGNAGDTRYPSGGVPSFGRVRYTYQMGKYDVTAGQYTAFLNAVAGVDTYGLYTTYMWSGSTGCKIERYIGDGTPGNPYHYRGLVLNNLHNTNNCK